MAIQTSKQLQTFWGAMRRRLWDVRTSPFLWTNRTYSPWAPAAQAQALSYRSAHLKEGLPSRADLVEGDGSKKTCLYRTWERGRIVIKSRKTTGKQMLKCALACVAASCVGAAVFAAPMTTAPKTKLIGPSPQTSEAKLAYDALGKGPALQLGRAAAGADEDCVRVTRMGSRRASLRDTRLNLPGIEGHERQ
jgi:hypothetical protein